MEKVLEKLGNVTKLVFDEYSKICRGEKDYDFNTNAIFLIEATTYAEIKEEFDDEEIDGLMHLLDPCIEINDELNMALLDYNGDDLMKKRISKKLEAIMEIDTMHNGAEYVEDIVQDIDEELVFEGRIYFDGYLDLLAFGIRYMDVAYQLYQDGFRDQAYRLAFMNPFVEESFKKHKGVFEKYNENDPTLLDELLSISELALNHASAEIEMSATNYMDLALRSKDEASKNLYHDYAKSLLTAMPVKDQFEVVTDCSSRYQDGAISKNYYRKCRNLVLEADEARLAQNN